MAKDDKTQPTMVYQYPGEEQLEDGKYRTFITDDPDAAVKDGWHKTPVKARAAAEKAAK